MDLVIINLQKSSVYQRMRSTSEQERDRNGKRVTNQWEAPCASQHCNVHDSILSSLPARMTNAWTSLVYSVRTHNRGGPKVAAQPRKHQFRWVPIKLFPGVDSWADLEGGGLTDSLFSFTVVRLLRLLLGLPVHFLIKCSFRKEIC
jgi:hypothetical protein